MTYSKKGRLRENPEKYNFIMNPYPDQRLSRCPLCEGKTGQRKVPLFIHIEPHYPIALNYTCRYCRACDLLMAHKHEIEHLLTEMFRHYNPAVIGNNYIIGGTVDKKAWRAGLKDPQPAAEVMTKYLSIFKAYYEELRVTRPGWYKEGEEAPEMPPPASTEWVKRKRPPRRAER